MCPSRSSHLPTVYLVRRERPQEYRPTDSLASICALTSPATLTSCDLYASICALQESTYCRHIPRKQMLLCRCVCILKTKDWGKSGWREEFPKWDHLVCSFGVLLFCKILIYSVISVVIINLMGQGGKDDLCVWATLKRVLMNWRVL